MSSNLIARSIGLPKLPAVCSYPRMIPDRSRASLARYWPHALMSAVCVGALLFPEAAYAPARAVRAWMLEHAAAPVLWAATGALLFCLTLALGPAGARRLGGAHADKEFGDAVWFAMLFSAGIGSGLMFWGAAEPLAHMTSPRNADGSFAGALGLTLFHWTLHPWAIYVVTALAIAHFAERRGGAMTPSAPWRRRDGGATAATRIVDVVALVGVLFGVVGSLGQGAHQLAAGFGAGAGEGDAPSTAPYWVAAMAFAAVASALGGIRSGIRPLSVLNMALALGLALYILAGAPSEGVVAAGLDGLLRFLHDAPSLSVSLGDGPADRDWSRGWTIDYLVWWIAWTPFVGVFLARISRGRTVRSVVVFGLLAPSLATWLWFTIFGFAAVDADGSGAAFGADGAAAIFRLLEHRAAPPVVVALTFALIFIFLVTSADSGAYVLAMIARDGARTPPAAERAFWGLLLAGLALVAVAAGAKAGLGGQTQRATETYAVAAATPLVLIWIGQMVWYAAGLIGGPLRIWAQSIGAKRKS